MPYVIRKVRNKNLYSVKNQKTGHVHSAGTTLEKAKAQVRLLESLEGRGVERDPWTPAGREEIMERNQNKNRRAMSGGAMDLYEKNQRETLRKMVANGYHYFPPTNYETFLRALRMGFSDANGNYLTAPPTEKQKREIDAKIKQYELRVGRGLQGKGTDRYGNLRTTGSNPTCSIEDGTIVVRNGAWTQAGRDAIAQGKNVSACDQYVGGSSGKAMVNEIRNGRGLPTSTVKGLIDASYTNRTEDKVGDLVLDRQLSTRKAQVYTNPATGQVVVANRGTTGTVADWTNNLAYSVGLYDKTGRMKQAEKVQRKAIEKYGHVDVNVGHSQGGIITRKLNDKGMTAEVINVNPASMGERHKKNETVLRSGRDLVSAMHKGTKRTHVVKGISNPLEEHSTKFLDRMKKDFVGKGKGQGAISNETTSLELDEYMDAFKIKDYHGTFVKDQLPELNNGFYIINLNGSSHWTALMVHNQEYYYFDPFGFPAPVEVERAIYKDAGRKVKYIFNTEQVQDIDHTSCGFYVVAWIRHMNKKGKDKTLQFEKFLELFDNPPTNDRELKKLIKV